ncbi:EutP/PduV family microcompartment system protein [Candidatus Collinsella stercoripullorum]|uniref:EutP/PduV family microcompartment system protein n=1 Tax=Candidatus Collinsella stercoripullorum TaxID=2838522 RepID=UPI0022E61A7C|nr:EutP/PduV family microcompartment system protein [Candidatus Collinsella stercoripullorum]
MRTIMLVGKTGAGKTSFTQAMQGEDLVYKKTQAVNIVNNAIDTPGEFVENRALYRALITSGADAEVIVLVQDCTDDTCMFAPGFATMFGKPTVGLVSKVDIAESEEAIEQAREKLELAGCDRIFYISNKDRRGVDDVKAYIGLSEE